MAKKSKPAIAIKSMQQLGEVVNETNFEDVMKCFNLSILYFMEVKKKHPEIKFTGMIWTDDGDNKITSFNIIPPKTK